MVFAVLQSCLTKAVFCSVQLFKQQQKLFCHASCHAALQYALHPNGCCCHVPVLWYKPSIAIIYGNKFCLRVGTPLNG